MERGDAEEVYKLAKDAIWHGNMTDEQEKTLIELRDETAEKAGVEDPEESWVYGDTFFELSDIFFD